VTTSSVTLVVRRVIAAPAARLFDAWTEPAQVLRWWGPRPVTCVAAEVDLKVGGKYRIGNRRTDGSLLWIFGEFEQIDRPRMLVYTWRIAEGAEAERVTVKFEPVATGTEVIVLHERIGSETIRSGHEQGWIACLEGLALHAGS
jgi:uncharacterized protein YndB with AHSA1/START domain